MANGGIIGPDNKTSFGKDKVTAQTSTGCLSLQPGTRVVNAVLVAGGGSGGNDAGGGGGAGGLRQFSNLNASTSIPVTIGGGGTNPGSPQSFGTKGTNSSFTTDGTTYCATGGGGGVFSTTPSAVKDGGSGGGYRGATEAGGFGNAGCYPTAEGQPGAGVPSSPGTGAGGGGGFSCAGSTGTPSAGGNGGNGICLSGCFPGSPVTAFAGGGGAGGNSAPATGGTGGTGGGGAGGARPPGGGVAGTNGCANTGGGGGASGGGPTNTAAGSGGSGIVVVKELNKASGVWSMSEQLESVTEGTWPKFLLSLQCAAVMVVGGGGAGPSAPSGGGGGAGGMIFAPGPVAIIACGESGTVPITIGAGGTGGQKIPRPATGAVGTVGSDTTVSITGGTPIIGFGGGAGGSPDSFQACNPTKVDVGGSGGGGVGEGNTPGGTNPGGPSIQSSNSPSFLQPFAFGNPGGSGTACSSSPDRQGGGGGGAGGAGTPSACSGQSCGGAGKDVSPVFGAAPQPFYIANGTNAGPSSGGIFAGGGGGRQCAPRSPGQGGDGGPGGGGDAVNNAVGNGTANTGGGGGAAICQSFPNATASDGGNGGSGIVLIRVPGPKVPSGFAVAPGTNTITTQPCGAKVAAFTVSGTLTIS